MKIITPRHLITVATMITTLSLYAQTPAPYLDTSLSFEARATDLLHRLTLEEKAGMLRFDSPAVPRLGIPEYNFWNECLHGVARAGRATMFPQAIGMAAMWDREMMSQLADAISDEARAKHHDYAARDKRGRNVGLTFWTPNINIFRDPRWGRGMETYGEDPYLTGELAVPFIKGLQGDDPKYFKLIATAKHFAVHSGPEKTRHSFDVWPSEYDMLETYTPHFKKAVIDAQVYSVMCAYQRLRGVPCCGSKFLENMLRGQWGFKGYIVSDCWAIRDLYEENAHHIVNTPAEAAAFAVRNGTDLNCGDTYLHLTEAVRQGLLTEAELDTAVHRILLARMKLGMFDPQEMVPYTNIPLSVVESDAHRELAAESARRSMVLLKNENNTLPFSKEVKRVAVIGPNADDSEVLLGNYNGFPEKLVTPLAGLRAKLPGAEVTFAQGCRLAAELPYLEAIPGEYLYTDKTLKQHGLRAEYFANANYEGSPLHQRTDANIDFIWHTTPPFGDMKYEYFSARWTGVFVPPVSGEYALGGEGYTGFDLYLDNKKIAHWYAIDYPHKQYSMVTLEAGRAYDICFEYTQNNTEYCISRLLWDMPKPNLLDEAIRVASEADVVVLCMGLSPLLEGEDMPVKVPGFDQGDRVDINLPASQTELIRAIHKLGKPTVLVLLNGSALAFNWEAENVPAIVEAWYPGQEGGTALADILFGDYNPSGRLPVTFYTGVEQIPAFDEYGMEGRTYRYFPGEPLYQFGHGLSYTTFQYKWKKTPSVIRPGETLTVSVDVTNTGAVDGDEIAQLYVSLPGSALHKPIRSLQGFQRVQLKKGEMKTVTFVLNPAQIAARDDNNLAQVAAGDIRISVGGSQPGEKSVAAGTVVQKDIQVKGETHYIAE